MTKGDWWFKFEIHTWLNDPKLRKLRRENRDSWLTACLLMRLEGEAELTGSPEEMANMLGLTDAEFDAFVLDLERTKTADVTKRPDNVTLVSRRYEKELNIKQGNKLRKQKQRSHAEVTDDSQDRVISKELEVKNKEKTQEAVPAIVLAFEAETKGQIHVDEILNGLRSRLSLVTLRDEAGWSRSAEWAFTNKFSSSDFLDCFDALRKQKWREGPVTAQNVADNLPNLNKLVPSRAVQPKRTTGRELIAINQAKELAALTAEGK